MQANMKHALAALATAAFASSKLQYGSCEQNVSSACRSQDLKNCNEGGNHDMFHHHSKQNLELLQAHVIFTTGARIPATPSIKSGKDEENKNSYTFSPADTNILGLNLAPTKIVRKNNGTIDNESRESEKMIKTGGGIRPMELTRKGQIQSIEFGKRIKERYVERIIPSYWNKDCNTLIKTRSTLAEANINSAKGVLTGLYTDIPSDSPALIETRFSGDDDEWMAAVPGDWCPILKKIFFSAMDVSSVRLSNTEEGKEINFIMNNKLKYRYADGEKIKNAWAFLEFRDQISSRNALLTSDHIESIRLEQRLNNIASEQIFDACSGLCEENRLGTTRLLVGKFLYRLLQNLDVPGKQLRLYSIDDITMMVMRTILDPYGKNPEKTRNWPRYCEEFTVELWQEKKYGIKLVRFILNGEPLSLPGIPSATDQSFYDLEMFTEVVNDFILLDEDIDSACFSNS